MKRSLLAAVCASVVAITVFAIPAFAVSDDGLWTRLGQKALPETSMYGRPRPARYEAFLLDRTRLEGLLRMAPGENSDEDMVISLPMPDGTVQRFRIEHSLVVEPQLREKFPELGATYRGYGIDDPTASARFDLLPSGFHSIVRSSEGTVIVDPAEDMDTNTYISFNKKDGIEQNNFQCLVTSGSRRSNRTFNTRRMRIFGTDLPSVETALSPAATAPEVTSGTTLRTYRLALSSTNEYCAAVGGGTVAGCLAAQVLIMNRVNGIYERDLAIHMNIIGNNDLITFASNKVGGTNNICGNGGTTACTSTNDPFSNSNGGTMLTQNQSTVDTRIGNANYDIGHVFSTGGGGVAYLGVPCEQGFKAGGVTGLPNPVGDTFAIDFVAHEMGHQFGADHTFNTDCSGNRESTAAYEPGSGVTVMGYAGVCGDQDLALHSIDTFHVKSIEQIVAYTVGGQGDICDAPSTTGNTPPTVSVVGGPSFTIPRQTPFALSATGTDANGDAITYDWQEYDLGGATSAIPNSDSTGAKPIFRPYLPTSGTRVFPSLTYVLNNANTPPSTYSCSGFACLTGELLPQISRTMQFRVIARDNRANGGGVNTANASVVVDSTAGPFVITSHGTSASLQGGSPTAVNWNVANTTNAAVNAQTVNILLSTDGGLTFPFVLASASANDGSEVVTLPQVSTTTARIKVQPVGKIFFDISGANFTITATSLDISGRVLTPDGRGVRGTTVVLTDLSNGSLRSVTTGLGGAYVFTGLPIARSYSIHPLGNNTRYTYAPQTVNTNTSSISNVNFTPIP